MSNKTIKIDPKLFSISNKFKKNRTKKKEKPEFKINHKNRNKLIQKIKKNGRQKLKKKELIKENKITEKKNNELIGGLDESMKILDDLYKKYKLEKKKYNQTIKNRRINTNSDKYYNNGVNDSVNDV